MPEPVEDMPAESKSFLWNSLL